MKHPSEMTQLEMAAYVQTILEENGINVVLSGGVATSLYSNNKYVSYDIDLVNIFSCSRKKIKEVLSIHDFIEDNRYFRHPSSKFFIEFPPGPLNVGKEPVKTIETLEFDTGTLRVISAIDSVKDRLAAYYHWGDQQSLHQAVLISRVQKIDLDELKLWSENEDKGEEFRIFISELSQNL